MVNPKKIDTSTMFSRPLTFVPQHAYDVDISNDVIITYGRLAKVLQLRNELSFMISLDLFMDVQRLEVFVNDVNRFRDMGVLPSDQTTQNHIRWRSDLNEQFENYGLSGDDFEECPLQHPNEINYT